jgi:hypothetical protein
MVNINGLNGFEALGGPDKPENKAKSPSRFNPDAQVSSAKDGLVAKVRLRLDQTNQDHTIELEVAAVGNISITTEQLESFKARVAEGLQKQETQIQLAVETFGAKNLVLREAIYSALAA